MHDAVERRPGGPANGVVRVDQDDLARGVAERSGRLVRSVVTSLLTKPLALVVPLVAVPLFLNYLGIQMDSRKADGMTFKINLSTPDNGERFVVEMSNATLTTIAGYQASNADLTITIDRRELEDVMIGTAKLADKVAAGKARLEGNPQVLTQLG